MSSDPLIGTTIGGCMILEVIGQGGMGVIYKARQKSLDRIVALKVLAPHLANDANFVGRFQREARAIARVNHPNILAVYDVGDANNTNYMIMELIDGTSLAELQTEKRGALPWPEAVAFIRQASQGLEAAQAAGIIHRDIKPENLMVTKKGTVKVSDFGLAKEADSTNTSIDAVMGTPAFMSPEQCDGKKVDGRSDIYSLGGTFYRLITGRLPFEAETAMSMMYRHKHEALIPPHEVVSSVPAAISAVIVKMMAKKREQRYQTLTEVIDALDVAARPAPAPPAEPTPPPAVPPTVMLGGARPVPMPGDEPLPNFGGPDESGILGRRDSVSGIQLRNPAASGRIPAGSNAGFGPNSDSSRMNVPSGVLGLASAGMAVPDDAYTNVARGDEMIGRGDRLPALKCYRMALQANTLDNGTRARIEQEIQKETVTRKQAAESLMKKGLLVEASRECRILVDLNPADEVAKGTLKDIEGKLATKRGLVNDIRTAMGGSQYERAIKIWDSTPSELRDEGMAKQIEQLRNVVVPSLKLAEQGEKFSQQGRLEEAVSTYEDALKINAACEPARLGLKDAQQKMQRIDFMLKEGYQYSLDQNYLKAIETWKPILALRPGHPQAVKSLVDAYTASGQNQRAHGDIDGAWQSYKGAAETDPQNKSVRKVFEELTNLRDKEQALIERAQDATARNRLGDAIRYWRDVQRLNPTSKRATQQLGQLGKQRSGGFVKVLLLLLVVVLAAAAGYQFFTEKAALSAAARLIDSHEYAAADRVIKQQHMFLFFPKDARQRVDDASVHFEIENAEKMESSTDMLKAGDEYLKLAARLSGRDRQLAEKLRLRGVLCRVKHLGARVEAVAGEKKWRETEKICQELAGEFKIGASSEELKALENLNGERITFLQRIQKAEREMTVEGGSMDVALSEYEGALKKLSALNLPAACAEYLNAQIAQLSSGKKQFEDTLQKGIAALKDGKYEQAEGLLEEARKLNAADPRLDHLARYNADLNSCDKAGMSLLALKHPLRAGTQRYDERGKAFCIDRYEYPNKAGKVPDSNVSWLEANEKCKADGKTLCTAFQWMDACKGENAAAVFPYGMEYSKDACNTETAAAAASGSKPGCKTAMGVFDMSGNLAEWVGGETDAQVMGGSFASPRGSVRCDSPVPAAISSKNAQTGFRCCKAPLPNP